MKGLEVYVFPNCHRLKTIMQKMISRANSFSCLCDVKRKMHSDSPRQILQHFEKEKRKPVGGFMIGKWEVHLENRESTACGSPRSPHSIHKSG